MPELKDDFVKKLSRYPEEQPDFEAMFHTLEERKRKWKRETGGQAVHAEIPSSKTRYRPAVLLASVLGIAVLGITAQQAGLLNSLPQMINFQNAAVGQTLNEHTEQSGVSLHLNRVFSSPSTLKNDLTDLEFHLSLEIPDRSGYDYAFFDTGTLTNLDTGEKEAYIANQINFTQREGKLASYFVAQGKEPSSISGRYQLELQDLYLRKTVKMPLNGKLDEMNGRGYDLKGDRFPSVTIKSSARVGNDWVVRYSIPGSMNSHKEFLNEWRNSTEQDNYQMVLVTGNKTIEPTNRGTASGLRSETFDISGLDDREIAEAKLYFTFPETVRMVEGDWDLTFTVDENQASQPLSTIPLQIDPTNVKGFDFVPTNLIYTPASIIVQISGYSAEPVSGRYLLDDVKLSVGNVTLNGFVADNNRLMFMLDQPYQDYSNEPVMLELDKARIVHEDLSQNWTRLKEPSAKEQIAEYKLDANQVIQYKYYRKGDGLMVITKLKNGSTFSFLGTSLKINGYKIQPSENQSRNSGESKRFDYYDNIPEGAELEINPGLYIVENDSYSQKIKLK